MTSAVLPAEPDAAASESGTRRSLAPAVVCAAYLAVAVLLTWRLWANPSTATVAGNPPDHAQFAWFLRYEATAITHGRLPALVTTAMNAPRGISMMWNTTVLLPGILLTPVTVLAGPQVSLNLLLTLGFAGSAASMYYVLRRYRASLPAAVIGGAVYGFSPALTHSAMGHYQLQFAVLPPLIVDAVLRLCLGSSRPVRAGIWLGVLVAAQIFVGEEMLFEAGLTALLLVAALALSRPKAVSALLRPAALGLATAVAVTAVLAGWGLWSQFTGSLTQHGTAFYVDFYKNPVAGFVTPDAQQLLHTGSSAAAAARYPGLAPEYHGYLGIPLIVVLIFIAVAFWRSLPVRAAAVATAALLLLSVGGHPLLSVAANPLAQHAGGLLLPWGLLEHVPVVSAGLADRLSIVADGAAAAMLAFGIDLAMQWLRRPAPRRSGTAIVPAATGTAMPAATRAAIEPAATGTAALRPSRAAMLVAAVTAVAVLPLVPRPLAAAPAVPLPAGWSTTLGALRLPAGARVLVVPVPTAVLDDALRWQADGGRQVSLIGGYFEGPDSTGRAFIDGQGFPDLAWYLNYLWLGRSWTAPAPPRPSPQDVADTLGYWQPQAVVADAGARPALAQYLETMLGRPTIRYGSMLGWRLAAPRSGS